jgi:carboxypeptidase D
MELTIELSYDKWPDASEVGHFWQMNKQSLLDYINVVRTSGVRGLITDASTGKPIRHAMCHMNGDKPGHWFRSDSATGDYFRVLLAGDYSFTCHARGYVQVTQSVTIPPNQRKQLVLNFAMKPGSTTEGDDSTFKSSSDTDVMSLGG